MARLKIGLMATMLVVGWGAAGRAQNVWPVLPGQESGYYYLIDPRLYPRERLPYFALYPPVYYSLPVARSYGYSPFAYPPGFTTPAVDCPAPAPVTIPNPFVPKKNGAEPAKPAPKRDSTTQLPVRITNPYVANNGHTDQRDCALLIGNPSGQPEGKR